MKRQVSLFIDKTKSQKEKLYIKNENVPLPNLDVPKQVSSSRNTLLD